MKAAMAALHQDPALQDRQDFDSTVSRASPEASDSLTEEPEPELPVAARELPREESILLGTMLRDVFLKDPIRAEALSEEQGIEHIGSVFWEDEAIRDWSNRHLVDDSTPIVSKANDPECKLNRSQKRAIAAMLAYPVSLIQGVSAQGRMRVSFN
jgi:hypothetical protein